MRKIILHSLVILATLLALVPLWILIFFRLANRTNGEILSSGKTRRYLLYVPKSCDPARPAPLVISIHGFAEWPAHQRDISHWNQLADQHGFIVVYPCGTGIPLRWRLANFSGQPQDDPALDVQFINDLIDHLQSQYKIDPARIYANGLSNGGGMSFLLACKLSARIAAFGGVAGAYLTPWSECSQVRAVPAVLFHGTADPIVPYHGGRARSVEVRFSSIPEWAATLAQRYGCDPQPIQLAPVAEVSGVRYAHPTQNVEVILYTIEGGGHSWPGGQPIPRFIVGDTSQSIDATVLMWQFFQSHPMGESSL